MVYCVDFRDGRPSIDCYGGQKACIGGGWLLKSSMVGYAALDVGRKLKA
jgi:hypothetical protein